MVEINDRPIDESYVRDLLPRRDALAHKWDVGGVIVVAGSPAYPGAAWLACRAAGRSGAGIVLLAAGRTVISTIAATIPEVAYIPLPETESFSGARKSAALIREHLERATAIVIGPGLGADDASDNLLSSLFGFGGRAEAVRGRMGFGGEGNSSANGAAVAATTIFSESKVNVVLDADGLNWLARQDRWWESVPAQRMVLTPHPGEMARLLNRPVEEITADPVEAAAEAAANWSQTVLLKGGNAVVSNGESTFVADLAASSLATAGSGDVLAGVVGGLLAQTQSLVDSAVLAMYVGPRAALRVEDRFGVLGVVASDLPDAIANELALITS
ncbi:MAG: ADP-dependent NAD(P)H-hydrate dehydratase [Thermomicrobiales bacterium]